MLDWIGIWLCMMLCLTKMAVPPIGRCEGGPGVLYMVYPLKFAGLGEETRVSCRQIATGCRVDVSLCNSV